MPYQIIGVPIAGDGDRGGVSEARLILDATNHGNIAAVEEFIGIVKRTGEFAIDTETSGLLWYRHACVMIQVFALDIENGLYANLAFPFFWGSLLSYSDMGWLTELLNKGRNRLLMWNAKFDMHFLHQSIGANFEESEIVDGMVMAQMLSRDAFPKADLKTRAREDLGYDMVDFSDHFSLGKTKTLLHYDLETVAQYAVKDPIATYFECQHLLAQLEEPDNAGVARMYHKIEKPLTSVLFEMEQRGLVIDTERVEELYTEYSAKMESAMRQIYEAAGQPFNINASVQFCDLMEQHGFPAAQFRRTPKSNARKLDEGAVDHYIKIASKKKLSRCLMMLVAKQEYSTIQKLVSTYIIMLRAEPTKVYKQGKADKDGNMKFEIVEPLTHKCSDGFYRIYPSFNQTKARTGRMSCDNPNAQNWPRPNKKDPTNMGRIRRCVIAPRGFTIGDLDYSQIELRMLGHCSREQRFIDAYKRGDDLHRLNVAKMLRKKPEDVTSEERDLGKITTSFGVIYGMHPRTLGNTYLDGDVEFAEKLIFEFFAANPRVHKFKLNTEAFAQGHGYVETFLGRRRYLPEINSTDRMRASGSRREAVNTVIQGGAADLVKLAMLACHRSKRLKELGIYMLAQIHDELIFLVSLRAVEELGDEGVLKEIRNVMENFKIAKRLRCPLVAEGHVAENWYEAH